MATRRISVVISANTGQYVAGLKSAANAAKQFNKAVGSSTGTIKGAAQANNQLTNSMHQVARGGSAAFNLFGRYGAAVRAGQMASQRASGTMGALGKTMAGMGAIAQEAVMALAGFTGVHAVISLTRNLFSFATQSVVEFDKAIVESLAILPRASQATRDLFEAQAISVSAQTKFNPAEVAEGYYFLISSGMDAAQSLRAVGEVAMFAQAGVLGLEQATELAVDVQTAFGLRSSDASKNIAGLTRVMNVMTQAAIDSNATIEQIAEAFTNKFATSLALGNRTIEEGAAILEVYAARGIKGRAAGTQAYMFLRDIQRAAIQNSAATKKYGIEVLDAQGKLNNLAVIQRQLNEAFSRMPAKQMREALAELGLPDRSVAAILPLIATAPEEVEKYLQGVQKSSGAYADVAARQMESIANALQNLKNKAAGAFIQLGKSGLNLFMQAVEQLKDPMTDLVSNVKEFGQEILLPALTPVAALLGGSVLMTVKGLASAISGLVGFLKAIGPAIMPFITLITLLKVNQFLIKGIGGWITGAAQAFKLMTQAAQQATTSNVMLGTMQMAAAGQQTSMFNAFKQGMTGAANAGISGTQRLKAGFTAVTQSAAGAGIAGSLAMSAITAGATLAITALMVMVMQLQQAKASIKGAASEKFGKIGEGFDTKTITGLQQYNEELVRQEGLVNTVITNLKDSDGIVGLFGRGLEFFGIGDEWEKESERIQAENQKAIDNTESNYGKLVEVTGLTRDEVQRNAEAMGLDLTLDSSSQKAQQARDEFVNRYMDIGAAANSMGVDITTAMGMGEEAQDEMLEKAEKTAEGVANAFASMIDPKTIVGQISEVNDAIAQASGASFSSVFSEKNQQLKDAASKSADEQVEAYNKTIEEKITSLEEQRDKIKSKKSKRRQEIENEIEALKDAKKSKEDFMSGEDPVASLSDFFSSLKGKANESKQLTDSLLLVKNRLAVIGIPPEFADEIIKQLSSLGPEGLPIIQQFARSGTQEFINLATSAQDAISKLNPEIAPTWGEVQNRIISSKKKVEQLGGAMVDVAGYLANQGITADQLAQFVGLGPEFQGMIVTMAGQIGQVSAEDMAEGIRVILDAANFGEGKIPEAIMEAMNWTILIAQGKTAEMMAKMNDGFSMGIEDIKKTLADSGLLGILEQITFITGLPGVPQPAGGAAAPPPPPGPPPKATAGTAGPKTATGLRNSVNDVLNNKYGYIDIEDRRFLQKVALNTNDLYKEKTYVMRLLKKYGVPGYADGGFEKHTAMIAKGGTRIWNEPETGGEAYIPLAMSKRARSERILGQVAKEFGYGLMKYADGGFYGTAGSRMIGGGNFGTQAQNTQTIVVPMQSKSETNFNGPIVGVNMEDAVRFAERKKRQKALTR